MPHWVEWWLPSPTQRCDGFIFAFLHNNQQSPSITQCFGLWQCQFWFDSWFEDKTSFCWVLPLYYSNEIFCTVHHQTLPTFFIKWSILCCQMLIKTFWIQNQNRHSSAGLAKLGLQQLQPLGGKLFIIMTLFRGRMIGEKFSPATNNLHSISGVAQKPL